MQEQFGAVPGFIGPVGARVEVVADEALRGLERARGRRERARPAPTRRGAGARLRARVGRHPRGRGGRHAPRRGGDPDRAGDRGGQHLQARHALLGAARRDLPRRAGHRAARAGWAPTGSARRGCWPPPIEQFADEQGISWPRSLAPFDVELVTLGKEGEPAREVADRLYDGAARGGARRALRRPRGERRREVRRRRAARGAAAADRRQAERRGRARWRCRCAAGQEKRSLPLEGAARAAAELWRELA